MAGFLLFINSDIYHNPLTPFFKGDLLFLLCKINKKGVNFEIPIQTIN